MKIKSLRDVHNKRSLIKDKIYEAREGQRGWFAVIDESGEEYAYPPELFEAVEEIDFIVESYMQKQTKMHVH
jgi:hypothetical protein